MNTILKTLTINLIILVSIQVSAQSEKFKIQNPYYSHTANNSLNVTNTEWKKILNTELYKVAREGATETAFTGKYYEFDEKGTYYCAVCGNPLFLSTSKFATTCGWPSFYQPIHKNSVKYRKDTSYNMVRTEVLCDRCGSHLGHIFDDGPEPTGKRFCMNSVCLDFVPNKK
ncbi:peptide-methionine (R)-S-oxide reductase MsrB [Elizabethkingia anophelis]|uniref:peptide-methionine (R)-S-oxide reductase MsrB n=1 Tax=Elizabethkingia anophelis TaxID=1117645 RepID=UPI0023E989D6|nr:peptide-methionine (R)-S-oxide reductase MsrB [Elizabethkingia anophelis]MCT4229598.1 peptide-methionine (R)-S-oxide reductase MsrB [Elizabethkingia anophelis]MCT4241207.1 peptide-methionine (R)-S-oxide reductase MsrB [Elizabethkingia anophelis]MCT4283598.1 peptide-methionine (R)-S-oxide reductase MsrB [Elizabethkingia anophelis]MCT4294184.1 peptide-methionine (R)-S-oxide reductase MsrB [Elizabethkingia anophelis]GJN58868.1 peptide-methionine (R)-S-oxide reductase [Elizabethkingia anophelis